MQAQTRQLNLNWLSNQIQMADDCPKVIHPRLEWMLYYEQKKNIRLACKKFGVSRKTFYKWLKRYRDSGGNPASLLDHSRRPHHSPKATPLAVVEKIIRAKRETGYGQRRLKEYLADAYNIHLSERTIWRLLKKHSAKEDQSPSLSPAS